MRVLFFVVLIGLIGAGGIYILSGGQSPDSDGPGLASKLKEIASRVTSFSAEGEGGAADRRQGQIDAVAVYRWRDGKWKKDKALLESLR